MAWASSAVVDCEDGDVSMIVPPFSKSLFFGITIHGAARLSIGLWYMTHSGYAAGTRRRKRKLALASENQNFFRLIFRTIVLSRALRLRRAVSLQRVREPCSHQLRDHDRNIELSEHRSKRGQNGGGGADRHYHTRA